MSEIPKDLRYMPEHEYLKPTGEKDVFVVGITDYAQGELGDVVYVELPAVGKRFAPMEAFGTIEAVKAVSDLYSPAQGEITEVNARLADDPSLVNSDPYGAGWMIKLKVADAGEVSKLLDAAGYAAKLGEG
jgi:glycine cleavage system H protein